MYKNVNQTPSKLHLKKDFHIKLVNQIKVLFKWLMYTAIKCQHMVS